MVSQRTISDLGALKQSRTCELHLLPQKSGSKQHRSAVCPLLGLVKLKRRLWIKEGRYWIAYNPAPEPTIVAVFYESANIPGRL
jgi:hypothetical protein